MKSIRRNVFETNSSSTHTMTMCSEKDFELWKSGKLLLNRGYNAKKTFTTIEDAIKTIQKDNPKLKIDINDKESLEDIFRDCDLLTYEKYYDTGLESFEDEFTTESGEKVVAFGKYGYDG